MEQTPDTPNTKTPSIEKLKQILPLYQVISEDNRIYNNIVWQFPTALVAANGLLIQQLNEGPAFILLIISILNFGLLHALFKLGHNQHALIQALQRMEARIKTLEKGCYAEFLPDFEKDRPWILSKSSRDIISFLLLGANTIYFCIESYRTIIELFFS